MNKVPDPDNAVIPSLTKAETRNVRMGPPPGRTFPDTFQLVPVSPAPETGGAWKLTMVWSKVKSAWNPTRSSNGLMSEVMTGSVKLVTPVLTVATGKLISIGRTGAVGEGDGVGLGVGVGVGVGVGAGVGVTPRQEGNLKLPMRVLQLLLLVE